ncbi:MAG: isoprenylcysteine carboxylmethyltransferase family protein [Candidatus Krumholzibacteriaceae bacterium]|jgi:protein-S-isoprenylcysteine O-methyltransferase
MIRLVLVVIVALFPVSEIALAFVKRSSDRTARGEDRGSQRLIWLSVALGLCLAIAAQWIQPARLPGPRDMIRILALVLLSGGLALRWAAIITLGRLFTVDVAIHSDHRIVQTGLYGLMRHPSYTGLLLAFLGLGVCLANWLSLLGLLLPITLAVVNRVMKEEQALLNSLGSDYAVYCARTKRFIPWLL